MSSERRHFSGNQYQIISTIIIPFTNVWYFTLQSWHHSWAEELVEDVVSPLGCLQAGNTRLLQNVGLYVTPGQLAQRVEVDFDELALGTQS